MQEDRELVLEAEHDAPQGVVIATLLSHTVFATEQHAGCHFANLHLLVGGALKDVVSVAGEIGTIASMTHNILLENALWDNPLRVHLHPFHFTSQQRGLRLPGATDDAHIQHAVTAIGIEMIGRKIDDDALARLGYGMVQAPAGALHITEDALSLFVGSSIFQHALQFVIELILRLDGCQVVSDAVVFDFVDDQEMVVGRSLLHIHIEESTIANDVGRTLLVVINIKVIEDARGIDESVAVAIGIAQTGFREVIVQSGCYMVDVSIAFRKLQLAQ